MKIFLYGLLALLLLMGCTASRYQKAEQFYDTENYVELVKSGLNCSEFTPECFQLKYYRTEGFVELGEIDSAITASGEAIDRIQGDTPLSQINRLYAVRIGLIREILPRQKTVP